MKITLNGTSVTAFEGENVLEVALRSGVDIPHLCYHPVLPSIGACRMCLVEIDGINGYPASCATAVADGMVVRTRTEAVRDRQRENLELILLEHPSSCLVCYKKEACQLFRPDKEKAGTTTGCQSCSNKHDCEVQRLTVELNVTSLPVGSFYRNVEPIRTDPFIENDPNLCILCGRCEHICRHHHESPVIVFTGRGPDARAGQAFDHTLSQTGCRFCGSCVDLCPTGSLAERFAKWYDQPEHTFETTCTFCDAACALTVMETEGRVFSAAGLDEKVPICVLGRFTIPYFLSSRDRLTHPEIKVGEVMREVSWEAAFEKATAILTPLRGEAFAFVCDRSGTVEDRLAARTFTEEVMGSTHYIEIEDGEDATPVKLPDGVRAVMLTGDFVDRKTLAGLDAVVMLDCFPTEAGGEATVLLPAAVLLETAGHMVDETGTERPMVKCARAPGQARQDWEIICGLISAMGDEERAGGLADEIAARIDGSDAVIVVDREQAPDPALDITKIRTRYRGHVIAERVPPLQEVQTPRGATTAEALSEVSTCSEC